MIIKCVGRNCYYFDSDGVYKIIDIAYVTNDMDINIMKNNSQKEQFGYFIDYDMNRDAISEIQLIIDRLLPGDNAQYFDYVLDKILNSQMALSVSFIPRICFNRPIKIKKSIINLAIRKTNGRIYYFNEHGIYESAMFKDIDDNINLKFFNNKMQNPIDIKPDYIFDSRMPIDANLMLKIFSLLEEGDTLSYFSKMLNSCDIIMFTYEHSVGKIITKISTPSIERRTGNKNKRTFDFIRIQAYFCNYVNCGEYLKDNKKLVIKRVIEKIRDSKRFQNFGVPVNFLRLTSAVITTEHSIEFVFELKELEFKDEGDDTND